MIGITKKFGKRTLATLIVGFALGQTPECPVIADPGGPGNTTPTTLVLRTGPDGHYYADGKINGHGVSFLVDTGASAVVIPEPLATALDLDKSRKVKMATASDIYDAYETIIPELSVGPIRLLNVVGNINPKARGHQILLGMSALRNMELIRENGHIALRGASDETDTRQGPAPRNGDLTIKVHVRDCMGNAKVVDRHTLECMKGQKPSGAEPATGTVSPTVSSANSRQLFAAQ